jgi:hypothetical protein
VDWGDEAIINQSELKLADPGDKCRCVIRERRQTAKKGTEGIVVERNVHSSMSDTVPAEECQSRADIGCR